MMGRGRMLILVALADVGGEESVKDLVGVDEMILFSKGFCIVHNLKLLLIRVKYG